MITVINIMPNWLSYISAQHSEPNIAVNPADTNNIAISVFIGDPLGGANAPVFISKDGGVTWTLNSIVPSRVGSPLGTYDITLRFAGKSGNFYAGILRDSSIDLNVLRTSSFTSSATMAILEDRGNVDQPYIQASTMMAGPDAGKDRVYIGLNDFAAANGQTATIDQSLDAGDPAPTFTSVRLEHRSTGTAGQNGPQIRPITHPDGTVYAIFYGWRAFSAAGVVTADVIVVRDDNWGTGAAPFTALIDPGDGVVGRRAANNVSFTWANAPTLGQERLGGDLAIAVDPNNSSIVYIAFCDVQSGSYTIHIRRSQDRGVNWSPDLKTVTNGKNPVLAINSRGAVGLAYQQVVTTGGIQRWETHFELTVDAFASSTDSLLASVPANAPTSQYLPYIGDYMGLMAVGKDFFGVFSANNTPDQANFPNGVYYYRNHNFATKKLLAVDGVTVVAPSIDPFFYKVEDDVPKACSFIVERSTYGKDEIDAMLQQPSGAAIDPAFWVVADGFRPFDFPNGGITTLNPTQNQLDAWAPTVTPSGTVSGMTIKPVAVSSDDPSLSPKVQRFTFTYEIVFSDDSAFNFPSGSSKVVQLNASIQSASATASIELINDPNPFLTNGQMSSLSPDLRVFKVVKGESRFNAPGISTAGDAPGFIKKVLENLRTGNAGSDTFDALPTDENASALYFMPKDENGKDVYNFALARVRYRGLTKDAKDVRVFFRLFPEQSISTDYEPDTTYREYWDKNIGQRVPLLGVSKQKDEYMTFPCFAFKRLDATISSMNSQIDFMNVATMTHDPQGAEVVMYYGCWLDLNQPSQLICPRVPPASNIDGIFTGTLVSLQDQIRGKPQCLIAEIAYDRFEIPKGATPSTSDKLAQRNLAFHA